MQFSIITYESLHGGACGVKGLTAMWACLPRANPPGCWARKLQVWGRCSSRYDPPGSAVCRSPRACILLCSEHLCKAVGVCRDVRGPLTRGHSSLGAVTTQDTVTMTEAPKQQNQCVRETPCVWAQDSLRGSNSQVVFAPNTYCPQSPFL